MIFFNTKCIYTYVSNSTNNRFGTDNNFAKTVKLV